MSFSVGPRTLAAGIAGVLLHAPLQAGAQSPEASAASADGGMAEIIVTAQRRSERIVDVPLTVTAQTGADLERAGIAETRDLPTVVPGLVFVGQGAWVQPNLRGVSTTITGADNPIALYLDGVYQPSQNGMIFDLPDISRIEVLKGPQGTLFGRNATGGAIQVITEKPDFTPSGRISASGGVYTGGSAHTSGEYAATAFFTGPLVADTVAGSLTLSFKKTDGYLTNVRTDKQDGAIESHTIRGKLLIRPSDRVEIVAAGYYSHRSDHMTEAGLPRNGITAAAAYPGAIFGREPWQTAYDSPRPDFVADNYGGSVRADVEFDSGTLSSITGYSKLEADEDVDVDIAYAPACLLTFGCIAYQVTTPQETFSQEINFASKEFFDRISLTTGAFAYIDRGGTGGIIQGGILSFDTVVHTNAYAGFAEANIRITDRLSAIAGIRYSWEGKKAKGSFDPLPRARFVDVTFNSTTPRFSLRYALNDSANVYFTYSEGFKSGVTPTNVYNAPATAPETIDSYEIGAKLSTGRLALNAAAFYYDYRDKQEQFFDGLVSFPRNAASAEIYGFELDGTWEVTDGLQARLALSYLPKAEYEEYTSAIAFAPPLTAFGLTQYSPFDASGVRLNSTPEFTGTLGATYTRHVAGGTLETTGSLYYSSDYQWEVTGRVRTDSYALLNVQAAYSPDNSNWKFVAFAKNLTNSEYINSALLPATSDMVMFGPPRLLGVRVEYQY